MAAPVLQSFAQRMYDSLQPLAQDDAAHGYALAFYCSALGSMFQIVEDYGRDQAIGSAVAPGWSQLLDLDRAPDESLAWLAQFVGVQLTTGLTDADKRLQIKSVGGWHRGTLSAFIAAAQATLTGTKTVTVIERNGDPYNLSVLTKVAETPSPSATLAALISQKPAGILLSYQNIDGQLYLDLLTNTPTYALAFTTYSNYQNLLFNNQTVAPLGQQAHMGDGNFGSGDFGGL